MTVDEFTRKYRTTLTVEMRNDIMRVFGRITTQVRNEALDEAIAVSIELERYHDLSGGNPSDAIRALKDK